jgi:hypothetical protein|tara:strand:+ start:228 stop:1208 length:981 start_codon:yes stop_codon:yes gene_type:complete
MSYLKVPSMGWDNPIDTGFGNRIQFWEVAYELNRFNDFKFTLLVGKDKWRETKFLNFPYTEPSNIRFNNFKDLPEIDVRSSWLKFPCKLDINESWYIMDEWPPYQRGDEFYGKWLRLITLKDKVLEKKIKEVVKDRIGIHIRHWPTIDTDPRPNSIPRFDYKSKMKQVRKVMDEFPNSKFYVSTDVTYNRPGLGSPLPDLRNETHWISEIYKDYDVVDYRDIISVNDVVAVKLNVVDENNSSWSKELSINNEGLIEGFRAMKYNKLKGELPYISDVDAINNINEKKILRDVVDLFSLIYSREFIDSKETGPTSSWSEFVEIYRKKL